MRSANVAQMLVATMAALAFTPASAATGERVEHVLYGNATWNYDRYATGSIQLQKRDSGRVLSRSELEKHMVQPQRPQHANCSTCDADLELFHGGAAVDNYTIPALNLQPLVPTELNTSDMPGFVTQVNITVWGQFGCVQDSNSSEIQVLFNDAYVQSSHYIPIPETDDKCYCVNCGTKYELPGTYLETGYDKYFWTYGQPSSYTQLTIDPCCYLFWNLAFVEYSVGYVTFE